jgi:hypothetical protein
MTERPFPERKFLTTSTVRATLATGAPCAPKIRGQA